MGIGGFRVWGLRVWVWGVRLSSSIFLGVRRGGRSAEHRISRLEAEAV